MPRDSRNRTIPDDWKSEDGYSLIWLCCPNSISWRGYVQGQIYELTRGRAWDRNTGNIVDTQTIAWEIYESVCVMADCQDLLNELTRIADALESVDQKVQARYTYAEMIADLESALGVGHLGVVMVKGLFDLMPTFKLKVDMAWVPKALFDYLSWRLPLKTAVTAIATSQGVMAAAAASGKVLALWQVVVTALGSLATTATTWKEIMFGEKNLFDDVFWPIWATFISADDGGDGGNDPDNDPELRSQTNIFVRNEAMVNIITVNCGCGGSGCVNCQSQIRAIETPVAGTIHDETTYQLPPQTGQNQPPTGWLTWDGPTGYLAYKCKASNAMLLGFVESLARIGDLKNETIAATTHSGIVSAIYFIFDSTTTMVGHLPFLDDDFVRTSQDIQWYVAQQLAQAVDPNFSAITQADLQIFYDLRLAILDDRDTNVCSLYTSADTVSAKAALEAMIDTELANLSYSTAVENWAKDVVMQSLSNEWLNQLWTKDRQIERYTDSSATDCSTCACSEFMTGVGVVVTQDATHVQINAWQGATSWFAYTDQFSETGHSGAAGPFGPFCGSPVAIDGSVISGTNINWTCFDDSYSAIYGPSTTPPAAVVCRYIETYSDDGDYEIRIDHT